MGFRALLESWLYMKLSPNEGSESLCDYERQTVVRKVVSTNRGLTPNG